MTVAVGQHEGRHGRHAAVGLEHELLGPGVLLDVDLVEVDAGALEAALQAHAVAAPASWCTSSAGRSSALLRRAIAGCTVNPHTIPAASKPSGPAATMAAMPIGAGCGACADGRRTALERVLAGLDAEQREAVRRRAGRSASWPGRAPARPAR